MKYENEIMVIISKAINITEDINEVSIETDLHNIGVNSITFVRLIIEIENFFSIEFPYDRLTLSETGTIKQLCEVVASIKGDNE